MQEEGILSQLSPLYACNHFTLSVRSLFISHVVPQTKAVGRKAVKMIVMVTSNYLLGMYFAAGSHGYGHK
jgi:hypothetical protein